MNKTILCLLSAALLAGCKKPTEEERLSEFRDSVKYKAYHFTSEKTTKVSVAEYNKRSKQPVTDDTAHSTLALLWFLTKQSEYSFIEADIAATSSNKDVKLLSLGLQSVALSKMGYPRLAKTHYDKLAKEIADQQGVSPEDVELAHKVMLMSVIVAGLYHDDPELAKFGADALGAVSQVDYLPPLVGAIVEAKQGNHDKAVEDLRKLNENEKFSVHKKAIIADVADMIAKSPSKGNLGSEVMERIVFQVIHRVMNDVFSTEDQRLLLERTKALPELITGKKQTDPTAEEDPASSPVSEK